MAQWLSWLERRPVTAEVEGSSPFWVVIWDLSSAGRASALQAEGHRFEPCRSHSYFLRLLYGEIAQLARAHGSYPWCRGFESPSRYDKKRNPNGFLFLSYRKKYEPSTPRSGGEGARGPVDLGFAPTEAKRRPESPSRYFRKVLPICGKCLFSIVINSIFVYNFNIYVHLKES